LRNRNGNEPFGAHQTHANNLAGISIKAAAILSGRIASHFLEPAVHDCCFQLDASPLLEKNHF
jgi:hypothetical protein